MPALNILLAAMAVIFLMAVVTMQPVAIIAKDHMAAAPNSTVLNQEGVTGIVPIALLMCLIPTTAPQPRGRAAAAP